MMSGATKDLGTTWFVVPAVVPFRATPHAHWPAPLDHFDCALRARELSPAGTPGRTWPDFGRHHALDQVRAFGCRTTVVCLYQQGDLVVTRYDRRGHIPAERGTQIPLFDGDFGADKPPRPGIHPQRRQDPGLPYWAPKLQGDADATLAWRWPRPGHDKAGQSKRKCEPQNESNESLHSLPPSPPAKAGVLESWLVD